MFASRRYWKLSPFRRKGGLRGGCKGCDERSRSNPLSKPPGLLLRIGPVLTRRGKNESVKFFRRLYLHGGGSWQAAVWTCTTTTLWPSGLRRWLKAPFRKGVGSNPTGVILKKCILWVSALRNRVFQRSQHRSMTGVVAKAFVRSTAAADVCFHRAWYEKHDLIGGMAQRQRVWLQIRRLGVRISLPSFSAGWF